MSINTHITRDDALFYIAKIVEYEPTVISNFFDTNTHFVRDTKIGLLGSSIFEVNKKIAVDAVKVNRNSVKHFIYTILSHK